LKKTTEATPQGPPKIAGVVRLTPLVPEIRPACDDQGFAIKNETRVAPKKLIHREADPARIIHLQSKSFVEGILNCLCGPL
jgi:hypothetical protein